MAYKFRKVISQKVVRKTPEKILTDDLVKYFKQVKRNVIYKFDLASDLRLTIQQASRNSKIGGAWSKGHPDLVIYEMRGRYGALFLELKAVTPYKKNGELKKNEHLKTQDWFHGELRKRGYKVEFSTGLEESIKKIEDYLKIK